MKKLLLAFLPIAIATSSCITQTAPEKSDSEKTTDDGTAQTPGDTTGSYLTSHVDCKIFAQVANSQTVGCLLVDPQGRRLDNLAKKVTPLYRSRYVTKADVVNLASIRRNNLKPLFHYTITIKREYIKGLGLFDDLLQRAVNDLNTGIRVDSKTSRMYSQPMEVLNRTSPLNNDVTNVNQRPDFIYIPSNATYDDIGEDPNVSDTSPYVYQDFGGQNFNYEYSDANGNPWAYDYPDLPSNYDPETTPYVVEDMPPSNDLPAEDYDY